MSTVFSIWVLNAISEKLNNPHPLSKDNHYFQLFFFFFFFYFQDIWLAYDTEAQNDRVYSCNTVI